MSTTHHQDLIDAIRVLRIELQIANDRIAEQAGLNPRDLDILDVIDGEHPCTPSHLAERTGVRRATLTGVLTRLEGAGWITRNPDSRDRRSWTLSPTERLDELRALYFAGDQSVRDLASHLPEPARETVTDFLVQTAEVVRAASRRS